MSNLNPFRWYKEDAFLNRVIQLDDANNPQCKSKFMQGLPNLFSERVRKTLWDKNDGIKPYHIYTYDNLINACVQEGLTLCNDLKLRHQLKTQKNYEKLIRRILYPIRYRWTKTSI